VYQGQQWQLTQTGEYMAGTYQPKYNHKSFQKRALTAIAFIETYVFNRPVPVSKTQIDQHFGQLQLPSAKWFKDNLLICVDPYYNRETHICKKYVRNKQGLADLKLALGLTKVIVTKEVEQQLATGDFEYKEQSSRLWNPLQFQPRVVKRPLLSKWGYNYNYDIVCAAPRLILQYARKCGLTKPTPLMDRYVNDTQAFRLELASELGMTTDQVKLVINSILNGGKISHSPDTSLFIELGRSHYLIDRLQASSTITATKKEIKTMWDKIKPHMTLTSARVTPRNKSDVYRELELVVIKSVRAYLTKTGNKGLMEHDGWTTCDVIDISELRTYVRSMTGYDLDITWEIFE
jgi:hypothetical protein